MADGFTAAQYNTLLDSLLDSRYAQLHVGDPGAAGTANASAETDRKALVFASATGASKSLSATVQWDNWDQGSETISWVTLWSSSSSGTFIGKIELDTPKSVVNGNSLILNTLVVSAVPVAA